MGIIRVLKETKVWGLRTLPGAPPVMSGRGKLQTEVCLSSEPMCLPVHDAKHAPSHTLRVLG